MANCYICSGFIHSKELKIVNQEHTIINRTFHINCWNILNRNQRIILEKGSEEKYETNSK